MGYTLSIENLLQVGFNRFRSAPGILIIYSIVAALALSNPVSGLLLGGPLVTGYYIAVLRLRNTSRVAFTDLFRGFEQFQPLFLLNLLISALVLLGFMLLVIPGIYFSVSYLFSHFFVRFYGTSPAEAVGLSRKMVSGNFLQVLWLWLVLVMINLLGALAFGVGLLVTVPFTFCTLFAAFDDIIGIPSK
jgi:uncharacterized membrane protein